MLTVEDWAEIRRLHRAEGMPIKAIVRVLGVSRNTVQAALARGRAAEVRAGAGGVGRGRGRAADPGAAAGVSDDAGDGDRGADRLDAVDPVLKDRVAELRPVYLPPDPGVADGVCGRGDRAVRSVVPADRGAGRVRAGPHGGRCRCW